MLIYILNTHYSYLFYILISGVITYSKFSIIDILNQQRKNKTKHDNNDTVTNDWKKRWIELSKQFKYQIVKKKIIKCCLIQS